MFKWVWKSIGIAVGALLCGGIGALIGGSLHINWEGTAEIGAVELATVVLSALSIILVVLTIFLAVIGFIGLSTINERLKYHSKTYFDENLQKGKPAFAMVQEVVREVLYRGVDSIDEVEDNPGGEADEDEDG